MTQFDTLFGGLATDLIGQYGKDVTFTSIGGVVFDPETLTSHNSSVPVTVKVIVEDYKPREFGTGLILVGDKKFSVASAGLTKPKPGDTITLESSIWSVISVNEIWSGEEIAMYEIQARK